MYIYIMKTYLELVYAHTTIATFIDASLASYNDARIVLEYLQNFVQEWLKKLTLEAN